jgi:excisionase family DNA binding protein
MAKTSHSGERFASRTMEDLLAEDVARGATLDYVYSSAVCQSEPVWNCKEAARFLRIHPVTVKRLARACILPGFRIGNRWRFRPSELDLWARSAVLSQHSLRRSGIKEESHAAKHGTIGMD